MVFGWNRKKYSSRHSKNGVKAEKSVRSTGSSWKNDKKSTWERRPRRRPTAGDKSSEGQDVGKISSISKIPESVEPVQQEGASNRSAPLTGQDRPSGKVVEKTEKKHIFGRSKWKRRERRNNILTADDGFPAEKVRRADEEYCSSPRVTYSPELEQREAEDKKISEAKKKVQQQEVVAEKESPAKPVSRVPLKVRLVQFMGASLIFVAAVAFCFFWTGHSDDDTLPAMTMPQSYLFEEDKSVKALLLWHETVLRSSVSGAVQLASGGKIAAVAAKDIVATVMSKGKNVPVQAPARGYFVPALDGAEGSWDYGTLWPGSEMLPDAPEVRWIKDLSSLPSGREVGKLINLPQKVRAVFYLDLTDALEKAISRGTLYLRREAKGPKWSANVRVYMKYGISRAKVVVDMPYFPMEMARSRGTTFLVCAEEVQGLAVPESAVVIRKGSWGVFELVGDRIIFRPVTGKPIGGGRFFISSGLAAGNPVILDAANAEEKRVRLW